jgi:hypothetical protein
MVKALTVRCASEKNRMGRGFEKEWTVMNYDAQQFDDDHEDDQFMGLQDDPQLRLVLEENRGLFAEVRRVLDADARRFPILRIWWRYGSLLDRLWAPRFLQHGMIPYAHLPEGEAAKAATVDFLGRCGNALRPTLVRRLSDGDSGLRLDGRWG